MSAIALLELAGSPFERGQAHGRALRDSIQAHMAAWRAGLHSAGISDFDGYIGELLCGTDFASALAELMPHLLAETRGIADGADVSPDLLFALQLMDEEWAFREKRSGMRRDKCSSAAVVAGEGLTFLGQNMDLPGYTDGYQVLLRIAGTKTTPAALVFSTAGMIALMGVNAAGIGVCVNSLPQLPSRPSGIPVAFVVRRLLEARSLGEAAALVSALPHATNQHYLIAAPGAARSFEASALGVNEYVPPDRSRVLHTNHPLATKVDGFDTRYAENSQARLRSLLTRLGSGGSSIDDIKAALSSFDDPLHPVCRLPEEGSLRASFTTGSMVSALGTGAIECWVSAGPPTRGYSRFLLNAENG